MYKILVDDTGGPLDEENKNDSVSGVHKLVFNSEYFEQMPLLEWNRLDPTGHIYTPRTGHEAIYHQEKIYLFGGTDDD